MWKWIGQDRNAPANGSPQRFERKFFLPPAKIPFALHLLHHLCPKDRLYPEGTVHSVYYDTADLDFYHDSDAGNYQRRKFRIRWYDDPSRNGRTAEIYLELKSRHGFVGSKQRRRLSIPALALQPAGMRRGLVPYGRILEVLCEFGYCPESALQPIIQITYQRCRFMDLQTGTRICLDRRIRSRLLAPAWDRREGPLSMSAGIIEVKGPSMRLSGLLGRLRLLGLDWTRYSKYGSCLESQLDPAGAPGRCWTSGRVGYGATYIPDA